MQKKQIKIGESYAVVQKNADHATPAEAVVVALDVPRKKWGMWHDTVVNDGVLVRFPSPVTTEFYASFRPVSEMEASGNYTDAALAEARKKAFTEYVVTTRCILEPWGPYKERRDAAQKRVNEAKTEAAVLHGEVEARIVAVRKALDERGIVHGWTRSEMRVGGTLFTKGAAVSIRLDEAEKLLRS